MFENFRNESLIQKFVRSLYNGRMNQKTEDAKNNKKLILARVKDTLLGSICSLVGGTLLGKAAEKINIVGRPLMDEDTGKYLGIESCLIFNVINAIDIMKNTDAGYFTKKEHERRDKPHLAYRGEHGIQK